MAVRKIYVNPGDVVVVRVIDDADLPKNQREWEYQVRPYQTSFVVGKYSVTFRDPGQDIYLQMGTEEKRKIL